MWFAYLTPSRSSQANSEHSEQPSMGFSEVGEDAEKNAPDNDEEHNNKQKYNTLINGSTP